MLYRSTLGHFIKPDVTKLSRLCVANCYYLEHSLSTAALAIRCISHRLLLAVTIIGKLDVFMRDVKKAFVISKSVMRGPI